MFLIYQYLNFLSFIININYYIKYLLSSKSTIIFKIY